MSGGNLEAHIRGMLRDSAMTFEEVADAFDAGARNLRAVVLLINSGASLESIIPHMESGVRIFADLPDLKQRLDAFQKKWELPR